MSESIEELQQLVLVFRDNRNWKQFHNPKDMSLSAVLETVELMEHFQWKNQKECEEHLISHKTEIAHELADMFYWVLLMTHDFDINLAQALKHKMKLNEKKYPIEKAANNHKKYKEWQDESLAD